MKENMVVFDLATTGFDTNRDEIIEFGAMRIENGESVGQLRFLVRPERRVSPKILNLTGIRETELEQAAPMAFYQDAVLEIIQNATLVGHNVSFNIKILENALGIKLTQPSWDTLELARIFFPALGRYSLSSLVTRLGLEERGRRALEGLSDLSGLTEAGMDQGTLSNAWYSWRILEKCREKALDFDLSFFDQAYRFLEGWRGLSFFNALKQEVARSFPERPIRTDLVFAPPVRGLFQSDQGELPPDPSWVVDCLAPGGIFEQKLPGYESRVGQVKMAEMVLAGLSGPHHTVIEAGTGTGKTLAYLIPCIWWSRKVAKKVVVATHTIPLQEQLEKKDLPFLHEVLPFGFSGVVVKGKGNYFCPKKWLGFLANYIDLTADEKLACLSLLVWLRETNTGDVQELSQVAGIGSFWSRVSAENEDCTPACSQARTCFLLATRQKAKEADLIIVNHSLLFSDIKTEFKVLPEYDYLVIDEAHHLHQSALQQLGFALSLEKLIRTMEAIYRQQGASFYHSYKVRSNHLTAWVPSVAWDNFVLHLEGLPDLCRAVIVQGREVFQLLEDVLGENQTLRLTRVHKDQKYWEVLETQVENLVGRLTDLHRQLDALKGVLAGEEAEEIGGIRRDLGGFQRELEEMRDEIQLALEVQDVGRVTWLERNYSLFLKTSPVEVSAILQDKIFSKLDCAILTSATISIGGEFEHFLQEVGLPAATVTDRVDSPFDFDNQMQFLVVKDLWKTADSEQLMAEQVAGFVAEVAESMKGRTLVLFTSHRLLKLTQLALVKLLEPLQIEVLAQGVDGGRRHLLEEFVNNSRCVLLGANSFWEGIDIPGAALSCVILVKLPFWAPTMPLIEARSELIELNGGNSFREFLLPEAVIRFKQGFGRLIRSKGDQGVVILLDARVIEKSYGKLFLSSIPVQTHIRGNSDQIIYHVKSWVESRKELLF